MVSGFFYGSASVNIACPLPVDCQSIASPLPVKSQSRARRFDRNGIGRGLQPFSWSKPACCSMTPKPWQQSVGGLKLAVQEAKYCHQGARRLKAAIAQNRSNRGGVFFRIPSKT